MSYYVMKIAVTTALVVLISEIAKRSSLMGAVLASVPLISVLAMVWLYVETGDGLQVAALARNILWLVLPSLVLFLLLPLLLSRGYGFYASLAVSIGVTVACYLFTLAVIRRFSLDA